MADVASLVPLRSGCEGKGLDVLYKGVDVWISGGRGWLHKCVVVEEA